jgi:5-deoxy-D-glucuronate isomerase
MTHVSYGSPFLVDPIAVRFSAYNSKSLHRAGKRQAVFWKSPSICLYINEGFRFFSLPFP